MLFAVAATVKVAQKSEPEKVWSQHKRWKPSRSRRSGGEEPQQESASGPRQAAEPGSQGQLQTYELWKRWLTAAQHPDPGVDPCFAAQTVCSATVQVIERKVQPCWSLIPSRGARHVTCVAPYGRVPLARSSCKGGRPRRLNRRCLKLRRPDLLGLPCTQSAYSCPRAGRASCRDHSPGG
jgi:hypothetical protein